MHADPVVLTGDARKEADDLRQRVSAKCLKRQRAVLAAAPAQNDLRPRHRPLEDLPLPASTEAAQKYPLELAIMRRSESTF
jgi:hypothetical protein